MSIAYVIHVDADLDFVQKTLLRSLPCNGFGHWISSARLHKRSDLSPQRAMKACDVVLAVISPAAAESTYLRTEIEEARSDTTPMIAVQAEDLTDDDQAKFPPEVWLLPLVDLRMPGPVARRELAALLPLAGMDSTTLSDVAQPIEWNEEIFSETLLNVLSLHDYNQGETLIATFSEYIEHRPYPYPAKHANRDLSALRRQRQFKLMRRYGDAVIKSGTQDEEVRRQCAQALIEQREFDQALAVLDTIVQDSNSRQDEVAEAYGLIGRTYKQQYQDDPNAPGSHDLLRRAIEAYGFVYDKDSSKVWHGVNKASCIVRGHRDGVGGVRLSEAKEIADRLLEEIDKLEKTDRIGIWDYATRVEALVVLERYEDAIKAVDRYIAHPGMHAFEVSSTYRQLDQLLQAGRNPRGRAILDRLWEAVQRHRGVDFGDRPSSVPSRSLGFMAPPEKVVLRPLLIRVTDPQWQPGRIIDLVTEGRLGTIISAQGSDASVKQLLNDPDVISVNDSPPAGQHDCKISLPYIRVDNHYSAPTGPYEEKGARALIAIIDNGIDVLHQAFLDAHGQSRIAGIWDQTDSSGPPPAPFKFGTYHDGADINDYVQKQKVGKNLGRNLKGDGHGTHVASIAAGRKVGNFDGGGVAPEARLLVVIADGQSSIGYSKSHIDALVFIDQVASQLEMPVVVNVSQGMNAGAHDGRSSLEVAFDEFSQGGRKPGRVIVKSAGNERHKGGHAKITLAPGALETVRWRRDPNALVQERLELWWNSADEFQFRLGAPSGEWAPWVGTAHPNHHGTFVGGTPYSLHFTRRHVDNGDSHLQITIGDAASLIPFGTWRLEIESGAIPEGGEIHAWIERGVGEPSSFENHADEEMTLSIPGTAHSVITVGAIEAKMPSQVGSFSSYGPTRDQRRKPELAAPGVGVIAARAGTDFDAVAKDGTSMAAPFVTGAIALLLSRMEGLGQPWPTASQISSALRQKTKNYNGRWDRGQGFGIVDVTALLAAF